MRALSGYAEWFWLLAKNLKPVENRNWSLTRYFGREQLPVRIYLHASKTKAPPRDVEFIRAKLLQNYGSDIMEEFSQVDWSKYRGHIIGEIDIIDEVTHEDAGMLVTKSPWFFGTYGFVVENGELYDKPIPYKGQLGFFKVDIGR